MGEEKFRMPTGEQNIIQLAHHLVTVLEWQQE